MADRIWRVGYLVEFGDSTGSFEPAGAPVSVEPVDDTFERVVWEDALGLSDRPARFARVRVDEQP